MQEIDPTYESADAVSAPRSPQAPRSTHALRRLLYLAFALLAVILLVLLPPLINVNRYQRRIATSISDSLGRPVHLDKVTLTLLPLPGFTLDNLVVSEDPAFGSEPIIRANSVHATLRISSLWRRRVEFSTISFTEPSVNIVHTADGSWNLESILLRAAHIDAAPTAQRKAGPAPRFPYIEATGARLNLKLDQEKTPISLTDAEFALWLPDPQQWRIRLQAHPARTDTNASDTGTLSLEGTLGRAHSWDQVPISLKGDWRNVPLGEASRVIIGHDAGLRGEMTLSAVAQGTIATSSLQTRLRLADARRADFIPGQPLNVDLQCLGTSTHAFHSFQNIRCNWPPLSSSGTPLLAITAVLPDIRHPKLAEVDVVTPGLPAATLLQWLHVASPRVPPDITAAGSLTGALSYRPTSPSSTLAGSFLAGLTGQLSMTGVSLINPRAGSTSLIDGDVSLTSYAPQPPAPDGPQPGASPTPSTPPTPPIASRAAHKEPSPTFVAFRGFVLAPMSLELGGDDPATVDGRFDATGYTLHLTGMASTSRLLALAAALPHFGYGLAEVLPTDRADGPYRVDLTVTRPWGGEPTWTDATAHPTTTRPQHSHPHR